MHRNAITLAVTIYVAASGVAADVGADELLVSSFSSDRVGRYDLATGGYLGPLEEGVGLDSPLAARIGPDKLIYVASEATNEILRYRPDGSFLDVFVTAGLGGLDNPTGITWDASGDLYVPSFANDSVIKYDGTTGEFLETPVPSGGGTLNGPDNGTIFGSDGMLYVPSYFNNRVIRYDLELGTSEIFIRAIGRPRVIVFHADELFVTSETADAVRRYAADGSFIEDFIQPGPILDTPVGLARADDGTWYVSSVTGDNVLKFAADGTLIEELIAPGDGGIDAPVFLTIVPEPGSLVLLTLCWLAFGQGWRRTE